MKVLAKRSNAIYIWTLFIVSVTVIYFASGIDLRIDGTGSRFYRFELWILFMEVAMVGLSLLGVLGSVDRLFIPKILIEYDSVGFYIYTRKRTGPILLRYEDALHQNMEVGFPDNYIFSDGRAKKTVNRPFLGSNSFGSLRIETPDSFIYITGVKKIWEVREEINRIIKEKQEQFKNERIYSFESENQRNISQK